MMTPAIYIDKQHNSYYKFDDKIFSVYGSTQYQNHSIYADYESALSNVRTNIQNFSTEASLYRLFKTTRYIANNGLVNRYDILKEVDDIDINSLQEIHIKDQIYRDHTKSLLKDISSDTKLTGLYYFKDRNKLLSKIDKNDRQNYYFYLKNNEWKKVYSENEMFGKIHLHSVFELIIDKTKPNEFIALKHSPTGKKIFPEMANLYMPKNNSMDFYNIKNYVKGADKEIITLMSYSYADYEKQHPELTQKLTHTNPYIAYGKIEYDFTDEEREDDRYKYVTPKEFIDIKLKLLKKDKNYHKNKVLIDEFQEIKNNIDTDIFLTNDEEYIKTLDIKLDILIKKYHLENEVENEVIESEEVLNYTNKFENNKKLTQKELKKGIRIYGYNTSGYISQGYYVDGNFYKNNGLLVTKEGSKKQLEYVMNQESFEGICKSRVKKDTLLKKDIAQKIPYLTDKEKEEVVGIGLDGFRANIVLKATARELSKLGHIPYHKSYNKGNITSYYYKINNKKIRLSNHELPTTFERIHKNQGLSNYDEEIIIDEYFEPLEYEFLSITNINMKNGSCEVLDYAKQGNKSEKENITLGI